VKHYCRPLVTCARNIQDSHLNISAMCCAYLHKGSVYVTRVNDLRLEKSYVKYVLRKFIFTNTMVNTRNSLPNWVVSANTTTTFETRLDKFWHNQDIKIYNFRAQLQGTGSSSEFSYE